MPDPRPDRCQAETRSGQRCSALAADGARCPWHSTAPEWVEKRRQWSVKGGERRSNKERAKARMPEPMTLADLRAVLSTTIEAVLARKIEPNIATSVATLARTLVTVGEASDLERRIAELERAAGLKETA